MCIEAAESTTNVLSSGIVMDGAGRHHTYESEKNAALFFSLSLRFMPLPRRHCGRVALVSKFPPQICLQILEQKDTAHENQCAESHLTMDAFFPRFSRGLMYLMRIARCVVAPRILVPFVKTNWISAAPFSRIRNFIAWN